jgi:predicted nuclease of restriction endonuclease-like (RecB) superfamily
MNAPPTSTDPLELYRYLRTLVDTAEAARGPYPKFALVEAYWHIGRIIVEVEQQGQERADYGIHLIELLSQKMTETFGRGYSLPNLWRFKQFFLAFPILSTVGRELPKLRDQLRTELCWSHYRQLMQLADVQERAFYIQQAADEQWTVRFMQRMIQTRYYHKVVLNEHSLLPPGTLAEPTKRISKLPPTPPAVPASPRTQLATIKKQLLERYVGYAFVAQRQFVSIDGQDRWAELVFFHYVLGRFVLVQLGDSNTANTARFTALLDAYSKQQAPTIGTLPIGFLIDKQGIVTIHATSHESSLDLYEAATLPRQFD